MITALHHVAWLTSTSAMILAAAGTAGIILSWAGRYRSAVRDAAHRRQRHHALRAAAAAHAAIEHRHREAMLSLAAARHRNPPDRRPLVLLVDGDAKRRQHTEAWLTSQHMQVVVTDDGRRAWSLVQEASPDLVLTEFMIPSLTAMQLLDLIRQDLLLADVPVIVRAPASKTTDLLSAGAQGVVPDDAPPDAMVAQIRFVLGY